MQQPEPHVSMGGEGEPLSGSTGIPYLLKASADVTGGAYALLESVLPPGGPMPVPHIHHDQDEAFYIISGEAELLCGDRRLSASDGAYVFVPRGLRHSYRNSGQTPLVMLVISSPPGIEQNFVEFATLRQQNGGAPLDREATQAVGRRHATEYLFDAESSG